MGEYLKRWRLSFQRPDKRAIEQDSEAVARWQQETWSKTHAKARKDGGEVLFADQVGVRSDPGHPPHLGEKGKRPVGRRSGNRFAANAMSAISTKGRMHFMVFTESFTAEVMCRFLDRLAGYFDRKIHLVVDGHSAHRSKQATDSPPTPTTSNCTSCRRLLTSSTPTNWSRRTSSTACPITVPSVDASVNRTSSAAT
ncbi:hypothetical protein FHS42_007474 [Streptomyces zagrosensis]|uniref:Transposase n=1 Tax=Streptomyces zagrosensis TaxID=1042984 RepID=A0A7W9QHH6_9ACTN|nr:hypothetical protein [Streptomyces zagrosensis]